MFYRGEPPPGTRWGLIVHHLGDYMRRWILRTPWGTLRLHNILRSDLDRDLHDHPFDFVSIIIGGPGYYETTRWVVKDASTVEPEDRGPLATIWDPQEPYTLREVVLHEKFHPRFSVIRRKAEDLHRLRLDKPVWTLVISGPWKRHWGFETERGWVHWREYVGADPQ
jgi:hypothetical protein